MKRVWTFGIFCIVLTLVFVGGNISIQREAALSEARLNSDDLVHFLTTDVSRNLFGLGQMFLGIYNVLEISPTKQQNHSSQGRQVLDSLTASNQFIAALLILDSTGKIIHWTGEGEPPVVTDRKYFTVHNSSDSQGLFVSKPFASRVNKDQKVFATSSAYRTSDQALQYVIVAIIDLEYFRSNYSTLRLPPGASIAIVSPQGDFYTRKPGHQMVAGKNIPEISKHLAMAGTYGFLRVVSPLDEKMRGLSFKRVDNYPLIALASYEEDIALAEWSENAGLIALFGVIVSAFFFILTLMSVRSQKEQDHARVLLQQQATTDSLTQLSNRRHAVECANLEIKKAQRQGQPLSFVLIDLDHFKKINDTYGHEKGDLVLKRVASVLNQICRKTDVVSRFGGEEFLLILPGTNLTGAEVGSEKIRKALENNVYEDFTEITQVTASFGVAQWQEGETDFMTTLRRADRALYEAKNKGRNQVRVAQETI